MLHQLRHFVNDGRSAPALLHSTKSHLASRMYTELLLADLQAHCDILESSYDALPRCTREIQFIYARYTQVIVCADLSAHGHAQLQICLRAAKAAAIRAEIFLEEHALVAFAQCGTLPKVSIAAEHRGPVGNYLRGSECAAAFGAIANSLVEQGLDVELESVFFPGNADACKMRLQDLLAGPLS